MLRTITLASGREVHFRELHQADFYEGLLEGLPTREMNARHISHILAGEGISARGRPNYLIPPTETPIEYRGGERYPFGEPVALPGVVCQARLWSIGGARDQAMDYSQLVIVWFQEDFAFPIAPDILKHIQNIDWSKEALDYEW